MSVGSQLAKWIHGVAFRGQRWSRRSRRAIRPLAASALASVGTLAGNWGMAPLFRDALRRTGKQRDVIGLAQVRQTVIVRK